MNLTAMRSDYRRARLDRDALDPDPIVQFDRWMQEAIQAEVVEPTAMSLATVGKDGQPMVRTVLLKGVDERGFVFFTNLGSRKARQIGENARVSLLFPWLALERQVLITGMAEKLPTGEVLRYFVSRPRGSQLAAWASPQSSAISSRQVLEKAWSQMKERFAQGDVPLPSFWGGYGVRPDTIEFWQGGSHRLHDRFEYGREPDGSWIIRRLAP